MTVMLAITGAALSLSLSSRKLYEADEARTRLNQKLRTGLDMVGADLRQAGERLPDDFPAIEIVDGAAGASDELILRRNLLDVVLPLCEDHTTPDNRIYIADATTPAPGCAPLPDDDFDGWPDNLGAWRAYRLANGGALRIYIYDPVNRRGEYLNYRVEDAPGLFIRRWLGTWQFNYLVANQCRIYILEERRYRLSADLLQLVINAAGQPFNVVDGVEGFQALANFQDGTQQASLGVADIWSSLRSIQIDLAGTADYRQQELERSVSTEFFPRNVLSQ